MMDGTKRRVPRELHEFKYLVVEKSSHYRLIIAFLYDRLEQSESGWVSPQAIVAHVREHHPIGDAYEDAECRRDLKQLETWNSVLSQEDFEGIRTLEEIHSVPQLWQISEEARRIERLVRELESEEGRRGSLDRGRLLRLSDALGAIHDLISRQAASEFSRDDLARLESEWNTAEDARLQIEEQAIRYLSDLRSSRDRTETDLDLFLAYRDLLKIYINEFLLELKDFRERAEGIFQEWRREKWDERLIGALVRNERERMANLRSAAEVEQSVRASVGRLTAFTGEEGTARVLEQKTTTRLLLLIERMERFVLEKRSGVDRKHQLRLLAGAFRNAPSALAAHHLAARAFGWGTPMHMSTPGAAALDLNTTESVWNQPAPLIVMRPSERGNPRLGATGAIRDRSDERARLRLDRARIRMQEAVFWDQLFNEGELRLEGLRMEDSVALSKLTRLVSECIRDKKRMFRLLDGSIAHLHLPEDPRRLVQVVSPQGVYHTRDFRFTRTPAGI